MAAVDAEIVSLLAHSDGMLRFFRDGSDSFKVELDGAISKADILSVLPAGSTWSHAIDRRSIFGLPFRASGSTWLALGVEQVVSHATRGAFPVVEARLYRSYETAATDLVSVARYLHREAREFRFAPRGFIRLPEDVAACTVAQADLLVSSAAAYRQGVPHVCRTLLLSPDEFPPFTSRRFLVGYLPELVVHFPATARARLQLDAKRL